MRRKQTKKGRKKFQNKMKGGMSIDDFTKFRKEVFNNLEQYEGVFTKKLDTKSSDGFQISLKNIKGEKRTDRDIGKYHIHVLREYHGCNGNTGFHLRRHYGNKNDIIPLIFKGKPYGQHDGKFICLDDTNLNIDKMVRVWRKILEEKLPEDLPPALQPFKSRSNMSSQFLSSALSMPNSRRARTHSPRRGRSPGRRGRSPNRSHSHFRSRSRGRSPSRRGRSPIRSNYRSGRYGGKKKTKKKCGGENSGIRSKSRSSSRYNPNCVKREWTGKQCLCIPEKPEDGATPVSLKKMCERKK